MIKLTDSEFSFLVEFIKSSYGIDLGRKRVLMEGRLNSYLVEQGYPDYGAYIQALQADQTGRELTNLLNRLTTNHTFFMRESEHFKYFRDAVLPGLERTVFNRDLRIWCAAASTGEEPYTLAMILNDRFGGRSPEWDKTLLATDISMRALETAKQGVYSAESIKDIPAAWKKQYFTTLPDGHVQVQPEIRSEVLFRRFNLMDPIVAKRPFHVVFCRNVMIYFDMPTKAALAERIYDAMAPGGYLFIGFTESLPKPTRFQYIMPSVYQKGV